LLLCTFILFEGKREEELFEREEELFEREEAGEDPLQLLPEELKTAVELLGESVFGVRWGWKERGSDYWKSLLFLDFW
jgi:hypothetical protein